jgi:hypothetical protein
MSRARPATTSSPAPTGRTSSTPARATTPSALGGGAGNDRLYAVAQDGLLDTLDCGLGNRDVAVVRAGEPVALTGCEIVRTVAANTPSKGEPGEPANGS